MAAIVVSTVAVPSAHAASSATCPLTRGFVRYGSSITSPSSGSTSFSLNLSLPCTGAAPAAGQYYLQIDGTTNAEDCTSGSGSGTMWGRKGEVPASGTGGYQKVGLRYEGSTPLTTNTFTVGRVTYRLTFTVDRGKLADGGGAVTPQTACPYGFTEVWGSATITEL
jgi:hypothetical protein